MIWPSMVKGSVNVFFMLCCALVISSICFMQRTKSIAKGPLEFVNQPRGLLVNHDHVLNATFDSSTDASSPQTKDSPLMTINRHGTHNNNTKHDGYVYDYLSQTNINITKTTCHITSRHTDTNMSCPRDLSFYTKEEILEGLRSKWLLFVGDSSTRGMVLALITHLDLQHAQPFDFKTWYNVTDAKEGFRHNWRGLGGFFFRLDYVFKRVADGRWEVRYKKASQTNPLDPSKMPKSKYVPEVFLPVSTTVATDEVRISFYNVRCTREMDKAWRVITGYQKPDIVYANVGAWDMSCDIDVIRDISSSVHTFVWGTKMSTEPSLCDAKVMTKLNNIQTLDKALIPKSSLGKTTNLERLKGSVHFANIANIIDVMRMLRLLGWPVTSRHVTFSPLCVVIGSREELKAQGVDVVPPDQGWKSPWKLPCRMNMT